MDCIKQLLCDKFNSFWYYGQTSVTDLSVLTAFCCVHAFQCFEPYSRKNSVRYLFPCILYQELKEHLTVLLLSLLINKLKNTSWGVQYLETERVHHLCLKNSLQVKYTQWAVIPYGHEVVWHMECKNAFHPPFRWNCEQCITSLEDETTYYKVKMFRGWQL
jgi:hypothetical protein